MGINSKDKRDIYYKLSKKNGYRARSVYKLIHIDEDYKILEGCERVVDLCGAPGGWSQYLASRLPGQKIISVDIQDMEPINGVTCLKEDITTKKCVDSIFNIFQDLPAQLVLFDGAPDVTGIHELDEYLQVQLVLTALCITLKISEIGGKFTGKIFRGKYTKYLVNHFKKFYREVSVVKPRASRSSSIECFILAQDLYNKKDEIFQCDGLIEDVGVTVCGNGPDPDLTQKTNKEEALKPKAKPIKPAYSKAINTRRSKN
ncbi:putative tRNA (cytidine(32)/guanosine(34)-2'-O)-methyltransferase [Nosema granulosis]|uniref:tRNA (Cytidine(32)/guanosine(34)-2'-O)-methyltransferase n=1 Tax=Nosema granulosis TaxID=83296 RepID=A0A9P6KYS9_9MICR|nr:putative tRNA (cytidine(32)/guanosine(34)-2'-O)-methyltransferase [Nosema granulosis]